MPDDLTPLASPAPDIGIDLALPFLLPDLTLPDPDVMGTILLPHLFLSVSTSAPSPWWSSASSSSWIHDAYFASLAVSVDSWCRACVESRLDRSTWSSSSFIWMFRRTIECQSLLLLVKSLELGCESD